MLRIRLTIEELPTEVSVILELEGEPPVRDREANYSVDLLSQFWTTLKKIESETTKPLALSGPEGFWDQAANLAN